MRFKAKTRLKDENSFLTLRRQLPPRETEYYYGNGRADMWSRQVSLFWLSHRVELFCQGNRLQFFQMGPEIPPQENPEDYAFFRQEHLFTLKAKCD